MFGGPWNAIHYFTGHRQKKQDPCKTWGQKHSGNISLNPACRQIDVNAVADSEVNLYDMKANFVSRSTWHDLCMTTHTVHVHEVQRYTQKAAGSFGPKCAFLMGFHMRHVSKKLIEGLNIYHTFSILLRFATCKSLQNHSTSWRCFITLEWSQIYLVGLKW
jgi:hypothetical protein